MLGIMSKESGRTYPSGCVRKNTQGNQGTDANSMNFGNDGAARIWPAETCKGVLGQPPHGRRLPAT